MIGGQQGNSLLELIKQGKLHAKKAPPAKKEDKAAVSSRPVSAGPTTEVCCKLIRLNAFYQTMLKSLKVYTARVTSRVQNSGFIQKERVLHCCHTMHVSHSSHYFCAAGHPIHVCRVGLTVHSATLSQDYSRSMTSLLPLFPYNPQSY